MALVSRRNCSTVAALHLIATNYVHKNNGLRQNQKIFNVNLLCYFYNKNLIITLIIVNNGNLQCRHLCVVRNEFVNKCILKICFEYFFLSFTYKSASRDTDADLNVKLK